MDGCLASKLTVKLIQLHPKLSPPRGGCLVGAKVARPESGLPPQAQYTAPQAH